MTNLKSELAQGYLAAVSNSITKENQLLKKSKENYALGVHIPEIIENHKNVEVLIKAINKTFALTKQSAASGEINHARYLSYLRPYKDFLENGIEKADLPRSLDTLSILNEVEKWFNPLPEIRQFIVQRNQKDTIVKANSAKKLLEDKKPVLPMVTAIKKGFESKPIAKIDISFDAIDKSLLELDEMFKKTKQSEIDLKKRLSKK